MKRLITGFIALSMLSSLAGCIVVPEGGGHYEPAPYRHETYYGWNRY